MTAVAPLLVFAAVAWCCWPAPPARPVAPDRPDHGDGGRRRLPGSPVARLLGPWMIVAVVVGFVSMPLAVALPVVGLVVWRRRAGAGGRRRSKALLDSLPESLDVCTVVIGAGGTLRDSVEVLAARGPAPVRPLAAEAIRRAGAGETFDRSLRWLQDQLGPGYQPLTGALLLAQEQGGSVGLLLARLSAEANAGRRRRGELRARRLPVALLVPLVCCSLPAVVVGAVVPLVIVALRHLEL